ncbi:MAG: HYR domain-containing protein [Fibrobacterales bacterium]
MKIFRGLFKATLLILLLSVFSYAELIETGRTTIPGLSNNRNFIVSNGNYTYVADKENGIINVISVINKNTPALVSSIDVGNVIFDMDIHNGMLYLVVANSGVLIYEPFGSSITLIHTLHKSNVSINALHIAGNYLYYKSGAYLDIHYIGNGNKTSIENIQPSPSVSPNFYYRNNSTIRSFTVSKDGRYVFIADYSNRITSLLNTFTSLVPRQTYSSTADNIETDDNGQFLSTVEYNGGWKLFTIYSLSNGYFMQRKYQSSIASVGTSVFDSQNNNLYVNNHYTNGKGIFEYSLSNPYSPTLTAQETIETTQFGGLTFNNNYLYVTTAANEFIVYATGDYIGPTVTINAATLRHGISNGSVSITADESQTGGSAIKAIYYNVDGSSYAGLGYNDGAISQTMIKSESRILSLGNHTLCAKANDYNNNFSAPTCITVTLSNSAPIAQANHDILSAINAQCEASVLLNGNQSSDPENQSLNYKWSGAFGELTYNSTNIALNAGQYNATLTVTDYYGATSSAITTINLVDGIAPTMTALPSVPAVEATSSNGAEVTLSLPTVADNCTSGITATRAPTGSQFPLGNTTVTYSAVDAAGNNVSATTTVTVHDTKAPVIPAIENIIKEATAAQTPVSVLAINASDIVDGTVATTNNASATFAVGSHTVTYSVTDKASNTASKEIVVTITDKTAPVITGTSDVSSNASAAQTVVILPAVTASDLVDGTVIVTNNAPATFSVGTTIVTYSTTDAAGNTATATLTVTVTDKTAPVISGNADVSVDADLEQTTVSLPTVTALDNVDGAVIVSNDAPVTFTVGTTIITYSATDHAGNTATVTLAVTVTDKTAPVISGNADVSVDADLELTTVTLPTVTALDNVDGAVIVSNDAPVTFTVGTTIVTYSATDAARNTTTATLTVTVTDVTAPVINALESITLEATGPETSVEMLVVTAKDNVDGSIVTSNNAPNVFTLGSHIVTFSAIDAAGNISEATMTVTITDLTAPEIPTIENITVEATAAETEVVVDEVVALDLVNGEVAVSHDAPTTYPVGETVVTYTTSDAQSNVSTLTIIVTVTDNTIPDVTAPSNIIVEATAAGTPVTLDDASALDLVDGFLAPSNDAPAAFSVGITTVTYSSTDAAGNTGSATMTVTVTDNTEPDLTVPDDITAKPEGFMTSVVIPTSLAFDLVDGKLEPSNDAPSEFPLGTTVVTYTVTDINNNTATKTINVNVEFSGLYEIQNTNSERCIEVYKAEKYNGSNVSQFYCNNTFAQRWDISHIGNGIYTLKNLNANKFLDVQDAGLNENVQIWGSKTTGPSQQWRITLDASGIAHLNPTSDLNECLDVQGASTDDNRNVISYTCNGTAAQDFILTDVNYKPTHLSGIFEIRNDVSNKCIDVSAASTDYGANVQQWECNFTGAQMWEFKHIEGEWYELINFNSGLLLDVSWGGSNENVQQWGDVNSSSQRWKIVESGNGTYNLKPKSDGNECLDVQGQAEWSGANIISVQCNGTGAQRFQLIDLDY